MSSSKSKKETFDRRKFLQIAGGTALAAPLGATLLASTSDQTIREGTLQPSEPMPVEPVDATKPVVGIDSGIDQMDNALAFLDRAVTEAPHIYGQRDVLQARWDEGRAYYSQAQAELLTVGFALQIVVDTDVPATEGVFAVDLVTPLPTLDVFLAAEDAILVNLAAAPAAIDTKKVLAKLLGALGIQEASQAIFELLDEDGLIKELDDAISARNMKKIGQVLTKILKKMMTKAFRQRLAQKIGAAAAAKIMGKVAARFVPYVGWALFVAQLLWAIGEQIFG